MTPASEFRSLRIALFGNYGGQIRCAEFLEKSDGGHVSARTVRRYEKGESPVPTGVLELLRAEKGRRAE